MTQLNDSVMMMIDIKNAYLYSRGYTSLLYRLIYYFFVLQDVFLQYSLVSQHLFRHLRILARSSSIIGKVILNIIVRIIMLPMFMYQSGLISLYFPCSKKLN